MPAGTTCTYYVSIRDGHDGNDGLTPSSPFRTIGRAAALMQAGDRCVIREGVYRETVAPAHSGNAAAPIRFEAYEGEKVVVSGCDLVTGWTRHEGNVYKAPMDWSMGDGNGDIVFMDGALSHEAMWPKITDRLDRSQYGVVATAETGTNRTVLRDSALLAFPDGHWNGGMVACVHGVGYFISTGTIAESGGGSVTFESFLSAAPFYHAAPGDHYFITRTLNALTAEREWYHDVKAGILYAIAPGEDHPDGHEVEAKRREYAFDLRGLAYIEIAGIDVRGASITTEDASHCTIARSRVVGIDRYFTDRQTIYGRTKGIELGGSDNTIRDSEISLFEGIGVNVSGQRNSVINCHIHDGNFEASYASLLWMTGQRHFVSHCTIARAGRTLVSGVFGRCVVQYCDISHANALTKDSGIIYLFNHDFDNSEFHHNWLHDNLSPHLSFGFYMDAWTSGANFFNNVVWNIPHHGLHLNRPLQRTLIYNNTFWRSGDGDSTAFCLDDMYGTQVVNNIFADGRLIKWGEDCLLSNNLMQQDGGFVDPENGDFRLRENSAARGAGVPITAVTTGDTPDLGAYPYGAEPWRAGHDFAAPPEVALAFTPLACSIRIGNCGFETGRWEPWTVEAGKPEIVFGCAWDYSRDGYVSVVRSNKYTALLKPGDKIRQTTETLAPDTDYEFWAGVKGEGYYRNAEQYDGASSRADWDRAPDGGAAIYRDVRYVGAMRAGDWLKYEGVDFANGHYDHFAAGLNKIVGPAVLEVRLDSPDGPRIGAVSQLEDYSGVWRYFTLPIKTVKGVHDIYLVAAGEGQLLIESFKFYHAFHCNNVLITITTPSGVTASRQVKRLNWDTKMDKVAFRTGPTDTSAIVTIENLGAGNLGAHKHNVSVDDCGLWKPVLS
ncbi:right-handed parallel beta-helix repeat-containing protein [Paenibacillus cymbidii]|uniref:right-handed parallel beta-helix repeat-containing protein n=1 Tax=Paenibacillus cymbidii TaxID=1639034 RepID=UPI0010812C89|nr:right-handed parallel beta-helix repeat-containing protein [Paenibacillus cymbidii]